MKRNSVKKRKSASPKKRSPAAGKRSKPAGAATTATKALPAAPSSATTAAPSTSSAPAKVDKRGAKESLFIAAYLANGHNATEAAKTAGYAEKSAHVQGCRMLKKDKVRAAIEARQVKLQQKHHLTTDRVLQELARIAFYDPRKLFKPDGSMKQVHELDDDTAAAIASVEIEQEDVITEVKEGEAPTKRTSRTHKVRVFDKNSAIEKAMRTLSLFKPDFTPQIPGAPAPGGSTPVNLTVTLNPSEALMRLLGRG